MKKIIPYELFENKSSYELTQEQVDFLDKYIDGTWILNKKFLVDIDGNFSCFKKSIIDFLGIKFGIINGDFFCSHNRLTSLHGSPKEVKGNFYCNNNLLTSLEGAPKRVNLDFNCSYNILTSLKGGPKKVGGNFMCDNNRLTSLEGGPKEVNKHFYCNDNELVSLKGAPEKINLGFFCMYNKLTSLEGSPREINRDFNCLGNNLTSLKGAPEKINGYFMNNFLDTKGQNLNQPKWILDNIKKYPILKTLLTYEIVQKMINHYPGETILVLKDIWNILKNEPGFDKLVFPGRTREVLDNLGDLGEFGL